MIGREDHVSSLSCVIFMHTNPFYYSSHVPHSPHLKIAFAFSRKSRAFNVENVAYQVYQGFLSSRHIRESMISDILDFRDVF